MSSNPSLPRILLVDDHRDTVELTAYFLTKCGYEIVRAYSVIEARIQAARNNCQIVVSDAGMPDGNGVELMRELKAEYGMAGILVSGTIDDGAEVENEGFKFLAKPVSLQALLETLQSLPPAFPKDDPTSSDRG